jgi:hypothetical protein
MKYNNNYGKAFYILPLLVFYAFSVSAQLPVVAKIDLIGIAQQEVRMLRLSIESTVSPHFTAALYYENGKYQAGFISSSPNVNDKEIYTLSGWGIAPEARYYPFIKGKPAPAGFFTGLYFRYRSLNEVYDGEPNGSNGSNTKIQTNTDAKAYNDGVILGYKFTWDVLVFEILGGYGPAWGTWETPNDRAQIPTFHRADLGSSDNKYRAEVNFGLIFPPPKKK